MKSKFARRLRRVVIAIVAVVATIFLLIIGLVNLFMTNGRLSPIIQSYAHEYLDADVTIGHAEGTFFRSFPYIGVKLDSCVIVTNAFHRSPAMLTDSVAAITDSLRTKRDTLARIDRIIVGLDLVRYFVSDSNELRIGLIAIERPRLRLITDSLGRTGWDVVRPSEPSEEQDTASSSMRLSVGKVAIRNARVSYFSRPDRVGVFADSISLSIDGDVAMDKVDAFLDLDVKSLSAGHNANRFMRRKPLRLSGNIAYDTDSAKFNLTDFGVKLKNVRLNLDGWLRPDTAGVEMDLRYAIASPSAEKLFEAIPKEIISTDIVIKDGAVDLKGYARGRASANEIPVVSGKAFIDRVRAQYVGRPDEIEDLTADLNMLIDKSVPDSSYLSLDIFHFKGGESEITAMVRVTRLLARALIECKMKAHVDFGNLQRVIPFDDTKMEGVVDADFNGKVALADIMRQNYGGATINGKLGVKDLKIKNDSTGLDIDVNAQFGMKTRKTIEILGDIEKVNVKVGKMSLIVRDGKTILKSAFVDDTSHIVPLSGDINIRRALFRTDSIFVFAKNLRAVDHILPQEGAPTRPQASHDLQLDTLVANITGNRAYASGIHLKAAQSAVNDTTWNTEAMVQYNKVGLRSPHFRLPIRSKNALVTYQGDSLSLVNCEVKAGRSNLKASGRITNFLRNMRNRKALTLNLSAYADTVDCNEIMSAVVTDTAAIAQAQTQEMTVDTAAMAFTNDTIEIDPRSVKSQIIRVPRHITLNVDTRVGTLIWDKLTLHNITGRVVTQDGAAHMTNLTFYVDNAKVITTLAYKAWPRMRKARANIFSRWENADIATLAQALQLDSLIPAIKPMRGKLTCAMAAEIELDSLMSVNTQTARASIHLSGQKVTLMDSENFRKIGKMLMFKQKDRNIIDTLSLNVLLDSGKVQVLPTVLSIDRYRMAAGGTQDLNMNMNYHISILKSPLPFKAGVNITGTPSDFDIDITTAKLKRQVTPEKLMRNDTISLLMRMTVLRNSYILSGQPMPDVISKMKGLDSNMNFAVKISEDEATEDEKREAARARREQKRLEKEGAEASPDTTMATTTGTTPDTTAQTTKP